MVEYSMYILCINWYVAMQKTPINDNLIFVTIEKDTGLLSFTHDTHPPPTGWE